MAPIVAGAVICAIALLLAVLGIALADDIDYFSLIFDIPSLVRWISVAAGLLLAAVGALFILVGRLWGKVAAIEAGDRSGVE